MRLTLGYLDAGTSSMIVQVFLGGIAAVVVTVRLCWNRFVRLLRIRSPGQPTPAGDPASTAAER